MRNSRTETYIERYIGSIGQLVMPMRALEDAGSNEKQRICSIFYNLLPLFGCMKYLKVFHTPPLFPFCFSSQANDASSRCQV
jgi:hypothetical protein